MKGTEEKRKNIKRYLLEKIEDECVDVAERASEAFGMPLEEVQGCIDELKENGAIEERNQVFRLVDVSDSITLCRSRNQLVNEDLIYSEYFEKYVSGLPDNIQHIWQYAFMEMMNNAIDHSGAEKVEIGIYSSCLNTRLLIMDNGIGIFKKIKEYYDYESLDDAVTELFKGKLTTDSKNHSGEGIFFTSRVLDEFIVLSDGKIFSHLDYEDTLQSMENIDHLKKYKDIKGTRIFMAMSNFSSKTIGEVMDMFADVDDGFTKTRIPIKNIYGGYPVSRSQARRLYNRFDSFREVELDFSGISEIGQGFAHELFVVFHNRYPETKLMPINVSDGVGKMIRHVQHTTL